MSAELTRRRFVGALVAAGGACAVAGCSWLRSPAESFVLEITGLIPVPDPWRLGEAFLGTQGEGISSESLLAEIFPEAVATSSATQLVESFRARQLDDFEQGRTVSVDGWTVSLTEARFCALLRLDR